MQSQTSIQHMIRDLKELKSELNAGDQSTTQSFNRELEQQARLDLLMALQMSLQVEWVINTFMEHIHSYLLFDGYAYQYSELEINIGSATQQGHSCTYQLDIEQAQLGSLNIYRGREFTESERVLLESLLSLLVYPLRNALHYRRASLLAHSDALTGVRNRSTFDESLSREISLSQRHGQDFTLLVIDIDHFKKVNDTYGHSAGDEVLKTVAQCIQSCVRATDMLFRYGGEEFTILLSNSDCEMSYVIADRILEAVRELEFDFGGEVINLTVSIGLACLKTQDDRDSLFKRADKAMYGAKNDGRNQIKVA